MSSFNRTPSFSTSRSYGGYDGVRQSGGTNPYAAGGMGAQYGSGTRSGSYTTQRGTDVRYGAAGTGGVGPGGTAAGRAVGGVQVDGAGGRSYTDVGRAGGAVGPGGNAVAGRSNIGVASGPRGTAVAGSRSGVVAGAGGVAAGGSRGFVAAGSGGAVAGGRYGAAGWHNGAYAGYHAGWVNGYWGGHYPGWGWGGYGAGLATGLGLWGVGSALYSSGWGYMPYANPYYLASSGVDQSIYNYSQPIDTTAAAPAVSVTDPGEATFSQARDSFKAGDYNNALTQADQALKAIPNDTAIHQFRAVVLFALGRYDDAAAALYGVLSVGPGWDWTTMIGLYPDVDVFTAQQRALEQFSRSHPDSAPARFVLAYLYMTEGQNPAAIDELKAVTTLQPKDQVSAQLLQSMTKGQPGDTAPGASPRPPTSGTQTAAETAKGGKLEGTWTASPQQGTTIAMSIASDGGFTWKVTSNGQTHQLAGRSASGSGLLTLSQSDGGPPLVGEVKWQDQDGFVFQALGGGPADPGLSFRRSS